VEIWVILVCMGNVDNMGNGGNNSNVGDNGNVVFFKFRTPYNNGLHLIPDTATHELTMMLLVVNS